MQTLSTRTICFVYPLLALYVYVLLAGQCVFGIAVENYAFIFAATQKASTCHFSPHCEKEHRTVLPPVDLHPIDTSFSFISSARVRAERWKENWGGGRVDGLAWESRRRLWRVLVNKFEINQLMCVLVWFAFDAQHWSRVVSRVCLLGLLCNRETGSQKNQFAIERPLTENVPTVPAPSEQSALHPPPPLDGMGCCDECPATLPRQSLQMGQVLP